MQGKVNPIITNQELEIKIQVTAPKEPIYPDYGLYFTYGQHLLLIHYRKKNVNKISAAELSY